MTTGPKLFTSPWTIRMPKFITDCWIQVIEDRLTISFKMPPFHLSSLFLGITCGQQRRAKTVIPSPEMYCAIMVASAAPPIPIDHTATNSRSSTMLITVETAKNTSGTVEFPIARSRQAKKL